MKFEVPPDFVPINMATNYVVLLVTPFFKLKNYFMKELRKKELKCHRRLEIKITKKKNRT